MFTHEEWRPVAGFPRYEVSSLGRVRSLPGRTWGSAQKSIGCMVLRPSFTPGGYAYVSLCRGGSVVTGHVHRLVLAAFVGPCPAGLEASHLNGNSTDNRRENLAWMTHRENVGMKAIHGTRQNGDKNGHARLTWADVDRLRRLRAEGWSLRTLAEAFGISKSQASNIVNARQWVREAA